MPVKAPNIIIPTGYEAQQRAAERKRKIAQALMERGLQTNPNMQSWAQVLGQLGSAFAGKRLDKKADDLTSETNAAISADYAGRLKAFQDKARAANGDPNALQGLVEGAQGDPFLADARKPYEDAYAARLKERENITKIGNTYGRVGDYEGKPLPNDPNAMVSTDAQGNWRPNMARIVASAAAGGNLEDPNQAANFSMQDPRQAPGTAAPQAMPAQGVNPNEADMVFSRMTPDEKEAVNKILQKYAGKGANVTSIVPQAIPYGNPTNPNMSGGQPPAGVTTDGRPYWIVNGVPFDNPEGR